MSQGGTESQDGINKGNKLHHARYFKKKVEEKSQNMVKKEAILSKARNSKVLNVVPMTHVKSFDRHV